VNAGEDYTEDAVALDNFRNIGVYNVPGSIKPDLQDVSPPTSVVMNGNNVYQSTFNPAPRVQPIDAISALFMHDHVYNTFILDSGTKSGTDWVLNFPTKRYYYTYGKKLQGVSYLFQRNIVANVGGCDDVSLTIYDREENSTQPQVGFSPPRPGKTNTLCWEANVLTFNASQVLGSTNNRNVATSYQNGWANLGFARVTSPNTYSGFAHQLVNFNTTITNINGGVASGVAVSYVGLPVIGFAVESYQNGVLAGNVLSNYGGNFVHKGTRAILPRLLP
ncbi:MAG: hypothetical protein ABI440_11070, partial [Casimicrobiaceae bacterium]